MTSPVLDKSVLLDTYFVRNDMVTTTNIFDPEFAKGLIVQIQAATDEGARIGARLAWNDFLLPTLKNHWGFIFVIFLITLICLTVKAYMGHWGSLGSFLYNSLYFSIIFVVGLIFGPEFLVSDYFHIACTIILYPFCYFLVGHILNRMGVRRKHR